MFGFATILGLHDCGRTNLLSHQDFYCVYRFCLLWPPPQKTSMMIQPPPPAFLTSWCALSPSQQNEPIHIICFFLSISCRRFINRMKQHGTSGRAAGDCSSSSVVYGSPRAASAIVTTAFLLDVIVLVVSSTYSS